MWIVFRPERDQYFGATDFCLHTLRKRIVPKIGSHFCTLNMRCRNIVCNHKGPIILRTTHIACGFSLLSPVDTLHMHSPIFRRCLCTLARSHNEAYRGSLRIMGVHKCTYLYIYIYVHIQRILLRPHRPKVPPFTYQSLTNSIYCRRPE